MEGTLSHPDSHAQSRGHTRANYFYLTQKVEGTHIPALTRTQNGRAHSLTRTYSTRSFTHAWRQQLLHAVAAAGNLSRQDPEVTVQRQERTVSL